MKKQRAVNTHRSTTDLNVAFYSRYDENFLFNKALALWFLCLNDETVDEKFKNFTADYGMGRENDYKWSLSFRAEVYFTVFLQFEALFALLVAKFQAEPHWLYLNNYTTSEIKEKVEAFLSGDISKLTNGLVDNMDDFVSQSVYANRVTPENDSSVGAWQVNLHNIAYILKQVASRYMDDLREYNGYKHGLRITRANDVEFQIPGVPPFKFPETIGYIDFADDGGGSKITVEVLKTIAPEQSFYEMYLMQRILRIIKLFRLAELKDEQPPVKREDPLEKNFFWDLDKRRLKERERFRATLNV